jgi:bifunctional non-homologous end joining protein LigD
MLRTPARRSTAGFIEPCLPSVAARPPSGPGWLHEIKHDGYRLMAQRHGMGGRLLTRNGNDWTARYPAVLEAINALKIRSCLIDGEIAVCDEYGLAVFQRLRHGSRIKAEAVLIAFDLLELDGDDLRPMPIEGRKHKLAQLVRNAGAGLHLSEHLHGDGTEIFEHACMRGYRQQAGWLALRLRPHRQLDQGQEPGGACGQARSRRRLVSVTTSQSERLCK